MEITLNTLKKVIFDTVYQINEHYDVENQTSRIIFFFGIKAIKYVNTDTYSIQDITGETYMEISNRFTLNAFVIGLKEIYSQKKANPDLRLGRIHK